MKSPFARMRFSSSEEQLWVTSWTIGYKPNRNSPRKKQIERQRKHDQPDSCVMCSEAAGTRSIRDAMQLSQMSVRFGTWKNF
jgi:hypothetical protein